MTSLYLFPFIILSSLSNTEEFRELLLEFRGLLLLSIIIIIIIISIIITLNSWITFLQIKRSKEELIQAFYVTNNKIYQNLKDEIGSEFRYMEIYLRELKESENKKQIESSQRRITTASNQDIKPFNTYHSAENIDFMIEDPNFNILFVAYKQSLEDEKFVPLSEVIKWLMINEHINSENEAKKLISGLVKEYPKSILIENVRGKLGKHIAIIL